MVSSISSSTTSWAMQRPDPSQMVSNLFSKLDTKNQGYLEKSDLESAFSQISSSSDSSSASVDEIFSQLDTDGDGKITEQEMSSSLQQLADQLDTGFNNMRTTGMDGAGQMPPPPPPQDAENDTGYTQDELTTMASDVSSTDSNLSALLSTIANNFDAADADGDGKVTAKEAMAYQDSQNSTVNSTSDSSSTTSSTSSTSSEAAVLKRIMQLMDSYGGMNQNANLYGSLGVNALSISA